MKKINNHQKKNSDRREFLKKAAYHAPTIIIMGELLKPSSLIAGAGSTPSGPPNVRSRRPQR